MRIVPTLLARHGMRPALVDLFDDDFSLIVETHRGVRCTACANVHHDTDKTQHYQHAIGRPEQAFFSDVADAETWLTSAPR